MGVNRWTCPKCVPHWNWYDNVARSYINFLHNSTESNRSNRRASRDILMYIGLGTLLITHLSPEKSNWRRHQTTQCSGCLWPSWRISPGGSRISFHLQIWKCAVANLHQSDKMPPTMCLISKRMLVNPICSRTKLRTDTVDHKTDAGL